MTYQDYIDGVLSDQIVVGDLVRKAVRRHVLDLEHAPKRGLHFDGEIAQQAIDFYPLLKHSKGKYAGEPFELRLFQQFVVGMLFGWRRGNVRRFRDCLYCVARGNGKSPFAAATAIQLTFADLPLEEGAEAYCFATKRDQARIVFDEAKRMIESCGLKKSVTIHRNALFVEKTASKLEPCASEARSLDGLIPHVAIIDELHEWKDAHREVYDKIASAMHKHRRQPLVLKITTAGDDQSHLWIEMRDRAIAVLSQVDRPPDRPGDWYGDDEFYFMAEVDEADDVFDPAVWPKANPMLNEPDSPVSLRSLSVEAERSVGNPLAENRFRRYHANQLVRSVEKPITPAMWLQGIADPPELTPETVAYAGLDLARSRDFAALGLCLPYVADGERRYGVRCWCWTCEEPGEYLQQSEEYWRLRESAPNLFVHPGNQISYAEIRQFLLGITEQVWIQSWTYDDSWARETGQWLQDEYGFEIVSCPQTGKAFNEVITRFCEDLEAGRIAHGDDPLLRWQAGNLTVKTASNGLKMPDRENAKQKIDGVVAVLMAMREAMLSGDLGTQSYYEDHDIEVF